MSSSNYQMLLSRLDHRTLTFILLNSLDQKKLVKLCNSCGIGYTGMRTQSVPILKLAMDLAEDFFQYEDSRKIIYKELSKVSSHFISRFQKMSEDKIFSEIDELSNSEFDKNIGKILFALLVDPRQQLHDKAEFLLNDFMEAEYLDEEEMIEEEWEDEEEYGDDYVVELEEENTRLRSENERLAKKKDQLQRELLAKTAELDSLRDKTKEMMQLLHQERKESSKYQKEITTLQKELQKLKNEIEQERRVKEKETLELPNAIRELVRQNKKINYYIERLTETTRPDSNQEVASYLAALGNAITQFKEEMTQLNTSMETRHRELQKTFEEVKHEIKTLQAVSSDSKKAEPKTPRFREELQRVGVFVDVQNMYYAARQFQAKLDFDQLLQAAVGKRRLIKAIAYVVRSKEIDQSGFITMLQQRNFEVKQKELRVRSDGSSKGDWDMEIAIDVIKTADHLDVVVLVSGDGDFVALVNLIKDKGPRVEVMSFPHNTSKDLIEAADRYLPIEEGMLRR